MTADIINLRRARKAKVRREAEAQAAENRVRFGRTKAEREQSRMQRALDEGRHDGTRIATVDPTASADAKKGSDE